MSDAITIVTDDNFNAETSAGKVLVDFWGSWCSPCKKQSEILDILASQRLGLKIVKANVDTNAEAVQKFGVRTLPTLLLLNNGEIAGLYTGLQNLSFLSSLAEG